MKKRCVITLEFEIETKDWGGREWRAYIARQSRDVVRAFNAMPKLTNTLRKASLATDAEAPTYLSTLETGAPLSESPRVFSYCAECPNTSYCATQGFCARVKAIKGPALDTIKSNARTVYGDEGTKKAREFALAMGVDANTIEDWVKGFKLRGRKAARNTQKR